MMKKTQVRIGSVAFKGYGVARIQDKVVFIPHTVAGDEAWIEMIEEKKRYSMGRLIQIVEPSPWRVTPPCPSFGVCGGCQWQHIDYSAQVEFKKNILTETLKRLGGLRETPSITLVPSEEPYGYRVRIQLKTDEMAIGYYQDRSHRIVDVDHCPIAHPLANQILSFLREELSFFPSMEKLEINVSPEEGKGVVLLTPRSFHRGPEIFLKEFLQRHPLLKGIVIRKKQGLTFIGDPYLNFTVSLDQNGERKKLRYRASPDSFFQVNFYQNQRLVQTVLEYSEIGQDETALDLYCGMGNLTLPLAMGAKKMVGIEENGSAVKDARFNAEKNRLKQSEFIQGKVEEVLKDWKKEKPDLIVLDPLRTGCKNAIGSIASLNPRKIVYVSCDPTTLSRDLRLFSGGGYALEKLTLVDLFPQSYHMEVIALLAHA